LQCSNLRAQCLYTKTERKMRLGYGIASPPARRPGGLAMAITGFARNEGVRAENMVTIKQVAKAAGVSVGTVSHVLTGATRVSEPLRRKVLAVTRQFDYSPNRAAGSLRTRKTRTLGLVVSDVTLAFVPQLIVGAGRAARIRGYSLIVANSEADAGQQQKSLALLRAQRVEGILLLAAEDPALPAAIARSQDAGIPVVAVDRVPGGCRVDSTYPPWSAMAADPVVAPRCE
jgi:DNA-binding LacI/PurR family transcriptional regulator